VADAPLISPLKVA